jgi:hypothetical protein
MSPTPWYRRPAVVVLAALAVALVLNLVEVKLLARPGAHAADAATDAFRRRYRS